jgi:hypothetical protein
LSARAALTARAADDYKRAMRAPISAPLTIVAAAAISLAGAAGCASRSALRSPETAVEAFAEALEAQDYHEAYRMLSAEYRAEITEDELRSRLERNPAERDELVALMARPAAETEITAEVPYGDGEVLHLRFEGGRWRLVGNVFDFYDQSTPRAAIRSFIRAIERRRYDVVLRFVPNADREGMTAERLRASFEGESREEIARLLENLRASIESPITQSGDHATMPYGERFTVELLFEDGVWKIQDPE